VHAERYKRVKNIGEIDGYLYGDEPLRGFIKIRETPKKIYFQKTG
jgi:hypothetical protein